MDIELSKLPSLLTLCWNMFFAAMAFSGMAEGNLFNSNSIVAECFTNKPLITYCMKNGQKLHAYFYLGQIVYFLVFGRKLVNAFDLPCFRRVYRNNSTAKIVFISLMTLNHVLLVLGMIEVAMVHHWHHVSIWNIIVRLASLYAIFNYAYWVFYVMHYSQHGTMAYLKKMESKMQTKSAKCILSQMKMLALVNKRINALLSVPAILYLVMLIFTHILNTSIALICQPRVSMIVHTIFVCLYTIYLIRINRRSIDTVKRLFINLNRRCQMRERKILVAFTKHTSKTNGVIRINRKFNQRKIVKKCNRDANFFQLKLDSIQSHRIGLKEAEELYIGYFQMKIFQLSYIDFGILWQMTLFVLTYSVLFVQTTN